MSYVHESYWSPYIPKLIGIYEKELWDAIETLCELPMSIVVDIGAAEGYYAVGMALRNPDVPVVAFEMEDVAIRLLRELVTINGVGAQVSIRGECEPMELERVLVGERLPVVISDIEGVERKIIDPVCVPSLQRAHILVEVHEFLHSGTRDLLIRRFDRTHSVRQVKGEPRHRGEFPYRTFLTRLLPASRLHFAVNELRPEIMDWLLLSPREASTSSAIGLSRDAE